MRYFGMKTQQSVWENPNAFTICKMGLEKNNLPTHYKIKSKVKNAHALLKKMEKTQVIKKKELIGKHGITKKYSSNTERIILRSIFLNYNKIQHFPEKNIFFEKVLGQKLTSELVKLAKEKNLTKEEAHEIGTIVLATKKMPKNWLTTIQEFVLQPKNWEEFENSEPNTKQLLRYAVSNKTFTKPTIDNFLLGFKNH